MKKLLGTIGTIAITATAATSVVACSNWDQYNQLMDIINSTKATFDKDGKLTKKSSTSVVYIGSKDNASSQSFEYALSQVLNNKANEGGLDAAKNLFNQQFANTESRNLHEYLIAKQFGGGGPNDHSPFNPDKAYFDGMELTPGEWVKFSNTFALVREDGTFKLDPRDKDLLEHFVDGSFIKSTPNETQNSEFWKAWASAFHQMTDSRRSIISNKEAIVQTDTKKDNYGEKIGNQKSSLYNLDGSASAEYTNIKPEMKFESIITDSISDVWSNESFTKLVEDWLITDLLIQGKSTIQGQLTPEITKAAKKVVDEIKNLKGPIFLIFTNGHLVGTLQGWNRYNKFGGDLKVGANENQDRYAKDVKNWIISIGEILAKALTANGMVNQIQTGTLATGNGDATGQWSEKDDNGASNWDYDKKKPTNGKNSGNGEEKPKPPVEGEKPPGEGGETPPETETPGPGPDEPEAGAGDQGTESLLTRFSFAGVSNKYL